MYLTVAFIPAMKDFSEAMRLERQAERTLDFKHWTIP
jgi:hypothetical protein